jgi:hypothetical protein
MGGKICLCHIPRGELQVPKTKRRELYAETGYDERLVPGGVVVLVSAVTSTFSCRKAPLRLKPLSLKTKRKHNISLSECHISNFPLLSHL